MKQRTIRIAVAALLALAGGFSARVNAQAIANGSFESQPAGTTKSIGSSAGGTVDTTTFTGWRVFSVGSPSVANFTATIITNHTDGNLAMRLSLTNTGGAGGLDHGLDNANAMVPVTFGAHYNISFDATYISGSTNLAFSVTEFNAATGYTGITTTNLVVSNPHYQTYTLLHWTPVSNTTAKVVFDFRQQNAGAVTYSVMSFDQVQFTPSEVFLDPIFTDNMVLQRDEPVRIYGSGNSAGNSVTVSFGGQAKTTTVSNGVWEVWLDPMPANALGQTLTINGGAAITCNNILVGDVWVLGGQSNMMTGFKNFPMLVPLIQAANQPLIRLSYVDWPAQSPQQTGVPQAIVETPTLRHAKWYPCVYPGATAEAQALLNEYSPGGYFFATNLVAHTQVPVGLVMACLGATRAQYWTPMSTLTQYPELQSYLERNDPNTSYLYNSVINPIRKFSLRGVLWYQGEGDNDRPTEYSLLFPRLIQSWRQAWGQALPFIFASLSSYVWPTDSWAYLREAQTKGLSQTNTGMIMTYDIGDYADIHPVDKWDVGYRFYMKARAVAYGENLISSGPVYSQMAIAGGQATLSFTNVGSGLVTRTVSMPANTTRTVFYTASSNTLSGFTMCGSDRVFYPATAVISGTNTVVVQSASVPNPIAVRYAWATFTLANLFNQAGFPSEPCRTDSFPVPRFVAPGYGSFTNWSFEAEPAGTTVTSPPDVVDSWTFTGWRLFDVDSSNVSFSATIIPNASAGSHAIRLYINNKSGGGNYGLDQWDPGMHTPVHYGTNYLVSIDAAWIAGVTANNLRLYVTEHTNTGAFIGTSETLGVVSVSASGYTTYSFVWTPQNPGTTEIGFGFNPMAGAMGTTAVSIDNVRLTDASTLPQPLNGSFEYSPMGAMSTSGTGGGYDSATFVGWRFYNFINGVGTGIVGFTGTIVDAGSYKGGTPGSHALRMDINNTGTPVNCDYALDNDVVHIPVLVGRTYTLSFDMELDGVSGGTMACQASIAEFNASGAYIGEGLSFIPTLPTDATFHHYSANYTAVHPTTAKVVIGFRPRNPGFVSALVLDNVVLAPYASTPTNIVFSVSGGNTLQLIWPGSHLGWIAQSNTVNVANPDYWFNIPGSATVTNLNLPISPATPQVFYRLCHP